MRIVTGALLVVQLVSAGGLAAQSSPGHDLSGTWVLDLAKSNFGGGPTPTGDSMTITRAGGMYQIDEYAAVTEGPQHAKSQWPVGDGQVSNEMPEQGASMRTTIKMRGDTATFSGDLSVQGQSVATQVGRQFLSRDGKILTRIVDIQPTVAGATDPIHIVSVYLKKR